MGLSPHPLLMWEHLSCKAEQLLQKQQRKLGLGITYGWQHEELLLARPVVLCALVLSSWSFIHLISEVFNGNLFLKTCGVRINTLINFPG